MSARQLVERFGSPLYAYDISTIGAAHADLTGQLPAGSRVLYSVKANPHPELIRHLHRLGCGVEVSSTGELDAALVAGVPTGDIVHNGPAKSRAELEHAVNAGVRLFSVDSAAQLRALGHVAAQHDQTVDALLRVNGDSHPAGAGLAMTGTSSQFGVDAAVLRADPGSFRHPHVTVRGLHFYLGTNIADEAALLDVFGTAMRLAERLREVLPGSLDILDLGGGFAAPYARAGSRPRYPGLRRALTDLLDRHMPHRPAVCFESGRYLTAECGRLVATVQDVKESKGRTFVLLDSGINHLGGMAGLRRVPPLMPELSVTADDRTPVTCDVVGPLCTPLDAWSRRVELPRPRAGDVVEVPNVGAYGLTGSLIGFLSHEPPVEVVLDGDRPLHVSRLSLVRSAHKEV
ncbi:diaminopimelate decarboxylase [Paractinoplanes deccanensis]|uniref:Diaminopimelate decarboxylase n=1 Tax=Paractinoplanes deccanensis TaxID=113561 RepID=A0ABQ3YJM9_9ACTN|nr:type III PLP-dependent enzyme [Actinoplanes deccanensis]GID80203.1 diaminopimelate decarboxylase [Actinoplanes deccanensis]